MSDKLHARQEVGYFGFERIADTAQHSKEHEYAWIQAIGGPATFNGTGTNTARGDDPGGDTIAEGDVVKGPFTDIQLSSGVVYAYYATNPSPSTYKHDV